MSILRQMASAYHTPALRSSRTWKRRWQNVSGGKDEGAKFKRSFCGFGHHDYCLGGSRLHQQPRTCLDGDTIIVDGWRVRLKGVDAPELGALGGGHAQSRDHARGAALTCPRFPRDNWTRPGVLQH
jgi:endonuclease YncB( thermonuclease family)